MIVSRGPDVQNCPVPKKKKNNNKLLCRSCRGGTCADGPTGREVNSQYDSECCPLTSTPGNIMDNVARRQLVLGSPRTAARAVLDAIVL